MIRIRPCRPSDFESFFNLVGRLRPDVNLDRARTQGSFDEALKCRSRRQLCAVISSRILGFCSISTRSGLWQQDGAAHIDELLVDDRWRGVGIGIRLLDAAIDAAGELGCLHVELDSTLHRRDAHRYYESRGFRSRALLFSKRIARSSDGVEDPMTVRPRIEAATAGANHRPSTGGGFRGVPFDFTPGHRPPSDRFAPALWFAFRDRQMLVRSQTAASAVPRVPHLSELGLETTEELYLGVLNGIHCYAAALAGGSTPPRGMCLRELRPLLDELSDEHVALAGRASQLLHWHATHARCGRCGEPMIDKEAERARHCPRCGLTSFPRVSPAVIVAVVRDGAVLLAQGRGFREGLFSVLAGFVEPGESLEAAVHRELREEVGIAVKDVTYFGSQPWPFPDSLMVAFTAEYAGGEIRVDESEIVEAGWYEPANLPAIPGRLSIARRLIDWFADAHTQPNL